MASTKLIATFKVLPKELFRISGGFKIHLRVWTAARNRPFDVMTTNGKVLPKALDPATYSGSITILLPMDAVSDNQHTQIGPNGASMRPNTDGMKKLARSWIGNPLVFSVPAGDLFSIDFLTQSESFSKGTPLPDDLILVHELDDRYSLQPTREMTVEGMCVIFRLCLLYLFLLNCGIVLEEKITEFLSTKGKVMTKAQWTAIYPEPTEYC